MKPSYPLLVFVAMIMTITKSETSYKKTVKTFFDPNVQAFNHLVIDKNTGRVYIGAVNRLYQLSSDLDLVITEEIGPKLDSDDCSVLECNNDINKKLTNNVNKALVIDYTTSTLISCGSLSQGICSIRHLQNISEESIEVKEAVVANTPTASTVAFIAPGPPNPPVSQVMYVGVTFTGSPYRSEVPAVSSRSLDKDKMFSIARSSVTTGTRMIVNSLYRELYPITYIYGFSSEGFSYFLTTQMKNTTSSQYTSKLVRICQNDENYFSYTEIPMVCTSEAQGGRNYNLVQAAYVGKAGSDLASDLGITTEDDVLFAVFSESEPLNANKPSDLSALCVYSIKSIRLKFMQNIKTCFKGIGERGLDFITPNHRCVPTKLEIIGEDFCGLDVNTPLGGEQPISALPVLLFNTRLTAVVATSTGNFTVVFIGTSTGHLKKVLVESSTSASVHADFVIEEGSAVNPDLHFDSQSMHLYAMTEKKVVKVKVQECTVYRNCLECLEVKDPYCGWCSLENKCSLRSDCQDADRDPLHWISIKSKTCPTITSVIPSQIQRTTSRTLDLIIDNLPTLHGNFLCAFTALNKTIITNATRKGSGLTCTTPRTDALPLIPPGQHHFTSRLSVRTISGSDFVTTNFTFFDCNTYYSCTQCVMSSFTCDWCVDGNRCTHDTAKNCRNDILVTAINRMGPSYRSGPAFCPKINAIAGSSPEILVASGFQKAIRVKAHIIGQFIVQTRFICQFKIEGRVTSLNAQLLGDNIYCDKMEFSYVSRTPNITATLEVIWGGSKRLDNPDNIHIVIYRCREMADNCGICLTLEEKYDCGWCQTSDRCEVKDQCDTGSAVWLNRKETCPNLEITSFSPELGPWEGGTNITIQGINLGKTFQDINSGISIAGIYCQPYEYLYIETKQIVCQVDSPGTKEPFKGPVAIKVEDYRGISKIQYTFVNPNIIDISPRCGPKSGGTLVQITGEYMNAGSNIQAFLGDLPCRIFSVDQNQAICITSPSESTTKRKLRMKFDKGERFLDNVIFEYVDDPVIESVESGKSSLIKVPRGIPAGGIKISVTGKNLTFMQKPQMYVIYEKKMFISECTVLSNTSMVCLSPVIDVAEDIKLDADKPLKLEYGFRMNNVTDTDVQNVLLNKKFNQFLLYPNPIFIPFEKEVKYYKSDYLNINGQNIDLACQKSDVEVLIGKSTCNVTSLSRQQLTCRPPETQPLAINEQDVPNGEALPEVIVIVGGSLHYNIGLLSYSLPQDTKPSLPSRYRKKILNDFVLSSLFSFL